jgi:hypothetical protein
MTRVLNRPHNRTSSSLHIHPVSHAHDHGELEFELLVFLLPRAHFPESNMEDEQ